MFGNDVETLCWRMLLEFDAICKVYGQSYQGFSEIFAYSCCQTISAGSKSVKSSNYITRAMLCCDTTIAPAHTRPTLFLQRNRFLSAENECCGCSFLYHSAPNVYTHERMIDDCFDALKSINTMERDSRGGSVGARADLRRNTFGMNCKLLRISFLLEMGFKNMWAEHQLIAKHRPADDWPNHLTSLDVLMIVH